MRPAPPSAIDPPAAAHEAGHGAAPVAHGDALAAARAALAQRDWQRAYDLFAAADRDAPLDGPDLERLAWAAYWSGHFTEHPSLLERAQRAYERSGDQRGVARVCIEIAKAHFVRLDTAVASGWFARAERVLRELPECIEHGLFAWSSAQAKLLLSNAAAASDDVERALELARRFGDRDLEACALHGKGRILLAAGDLEAGLALIDEASAAAMGGELDVNAAGTIYCGTIWACRDVTDYRRAAEWTDASVRWSERNRVSYFPGLCRVHRAEIHRLRGELAEATRDAEAACRELLDSNVMNAGWAFHELGETALRRGDLTAAAAAFRRALELGTDPQPGLARLWIAEGNADAACQALERSLQNAGMHACSNRAHLLPALVTACLAVGRVERAREAVADLEALRDRLQTAALTAAAAEARGQLELAAGDATSATDSLRRAWQSWCALEAPYEAASAQLQLAAAFRATGDGVAARFELDAARAAFERIGAVRDASQAALAGGASPPGAAPDAEARVLRALLFTDIVGSTPLVEALGDEAWTNLVAWHDRHLRRAFGAHGGREVDHAGDGFFVVFDDAEAAVACAQAIQRGLAAHRQEHGFAPQVRIGVHLASIVAQETGYVGRGVHEGARIAAAAGAGQILASADVIDACAGRCAAAPVEEVQLKGLSAPTRVARIEWR